MLSASALYNVVQYRWRGRSVRKMCAAFDVFARSQVILVKNGSTGPVPMRRQWCAAAPPGEDLPGLLNLGVTMARLSPSKLVWWKRKKNQRQRKGTTKRTLVSLQE